MNKVETIIRTSIENVIHLSLATAKDNKPWVCEVHYAYDNDLNIYFISRPSRRHSIEACSNNYVSGNIVKQHKIGEKVQGVYFEGHIEMLTDVKEDHVAFHSYQKRFGASPTVLDEQKEEDGHRWYKITVSKFYLFDEVDMEPAGKYDLNWK